MMKFDRIQLNNSLFYSVKLSLFNKKYMIGSAWSLIKGDWWYEEKTDKKKFFDISKEDRNQSIQYGLYMGRLSFVFMREK